MKNSKWLSMAMAMMLVCLIGCQDAYVAPTYDVDDLIAQIQQHHRDIEARAQSTDSEASNAIGMLHHSLHEIDATLKTLIAYPESQMSLSPDQIDAMRGAAKELLVSYRKLDDAFHKSYSIDFESARESLETGLKRLNEFNAEVAPSPN